MVKGIDIDDEENNSNDDTDQSNYDAKSENTFECLKRKPSFVAYIVDSLVLGLFHFEYSDKIIMKKNPKVILLGETRTFNFIQMWERQASFKS